MVEQFRVVSAGRPRGVWRDSYEAAMADAVDLELASWDASKRTHYLAVPVSIERRGQPDIGIPILAYPSRRPRHREAWSDEDVATLRRIAASGEVAVVAAAELGRSREAVDRKARQLQIRFRGGER
jgi:hypothetical protein